MANYNFESEGSKTTVSRIYDKLDKMYEDMLAYADKYGLKVDKSLNSYTKFLQYFDEEYYNCGNFNNFDIPFIDYTLYTDNTISIDNTIWLPRSLANKFNPLEIDKHYNYITNCYFDALIKNYLDCYYLLRDTFYEDVLLDIEAWITENGKNRNLPNVKYAIMTNEKREQEISEKNKKNNLIKGLRMNLRDYGSVLSDEDYQTIQNIIDRLS